MGNAKKAQEAEETDKNNKMKIDKPIKILKKSKPSMPGEISGKCNPSNLNDKFVLKRVLNHITRKRKGKSKSDSREACPVEDLTDDKVDLQVKLRCRQLTQVAQELRKAIMRHDWDEATTLLMILCHPGLKLYSPIIFKTCFILLCNHPDSSFGLLQNFVRNTSGYILEEEINKFIRILFALNKASVDPLERGKFVRMTGDYKVVTDPQFEKL